MIIMRNARNLIQHEFIGLQCEIVESRNKFNVGIKGKISYETMKMIEIRDSSGVKRIQKKDSVFSMRLGEKNIQIDGNYIIQRPEDRVKKAATRW